MIANWLEISDLSDPSSVYAEETIKAASLILYNLTGQKFPGIREVTEFYVARIEEQERYSMFPDPLFYERLGLLEPRALSPTRALPLYGTPVRNVLAVKESGKDLDPSEYMVVNKNKLLRRPDGYQWMTCGGIEITYQYGSRPPLAGKLAAMQLADELVMALNNDENCSLPSGVTSVSRQGVDISFIDPQDFIKEGRTGLAAVDLFIHSVNPVRAHKRARVFSPHVPRRERV